MTTPTITPTNEHVLTVVEPNGRGDATLDIAHDVIARGGRASVVMVITDRVEADIRGFAASGGLSVAEAEAQAIDQLATFCSERVGDDVAPIVERFGWLGTDIRRHITDDVTAVAVPEGLLAARSATRLARKLGRPVLVTPDRAA